MSQPKLILPPCWYCTIGNETKNLFKDTIQDLSLAQTAAREWILNDKIPYTDIRILRLDQGECIYSYTLEDAELVGKFTRQQFKCQTCKRRDPGCTSLNSICVICICMSMKKDNDTDDGFKYDATGDQPSQTQ